MQPTKRVFVDATVPGPSYLGYGSEEPWMKRAGNIFMSSSFAEFVPTSPAANCRISKQTMQEFMVWLEETDGDSSSNVTDEHGAKQPLTPEEVFWQGPAVDTSASLRPDTLRSDAEAGSSAATQAEKLSYNGKGKGKKRQLVEGDDAAANEAMPTAKKARSTGGDSGSKFTSFPATTISASSSAAAVGPSNSMHAASVASSALTLLQVAPHVPQPAPSVPLAAPPAPMAAPQVQWPQAIPWTGPGNPPVPAAIPARIHQLAVHGPLPHWDNCALFAHLTDEEILGGAVNQVDLCGTTLMRLAGRFDNKQLAGYINALFLRSGGVARDANGKNVAKALGNARAEWARRNNTSEDAVYDMQVQERKRNGVNHSKTSRANQSNGT